MGKTKVTDPEKKLSLDIGKYAENCKTVYNLWQVKPGIIFDINNPKYNEDDTRTSASTPCP